MSTRRLELSGVGVIVPPPLKGRKPKVFVDCCGESVAVTEEVVSLTELEAVQNLVNVVDYVSGKPVPRLFAVPGFPAASLYSSESYLHASRVLGRPDYAGDYGMTTVGAAISESGRLRDAGLPLDTVISSPIHFSSKSFKSSIVSNSISTGLDTLDAKISGYQGDMGLKFYMEFASRIERAIESLVYNFIKCGSNFPVLVIPTAQLGKLSRCAIQTVVNQKLASVLKRWYPVVSDLKYPTFIHSENAIPVTGTYDLLPQGTITSCRVHDSISGFSMAYYLISDNVTNTQASNVGRQWRFAHALENGFNPLDVNYGAFIHSLTRASVALDANVASEAGPLVSPPINAGFPAHEAIGASEIRVVRGYSLSVFLNYLNNSGVEGLRVFLEGTYASGRPAALTDFSYMNRAVLVKVSITPQIVVDLNVAYADALGLQDFTGSKCKSVKVVPIFDKGSKAFLQSISAVTANIQCDIDSMVCGTNLFRFECECPPVVIKAESDLFIPAYTSNRTVNQGGRITF